MQNGTENLGLFREGLMDKGFENWDVLHEKKCLSLPTSECRYEVELKAAIFFVADELFGYKVLSFFFGKHVKLVLPFSNL